MSTKISNTSNTGGATGAKERLDARVLRAIDTLALSDQARRLRATYFDTHTRIALERALIAVEAWKESEGELVAMRRAHLFERVLAGIPVVIHPDELTAGSETKWFRGVYPLPDHDPAALKPQIERGMLNLQSVVHEAKIAEEDWAKLAQANDYFTGQTGPDLIRQMEHEIHGSWWEDFMEVSGTTEFTNVLLAGVPQFERVVAQGLNGVIAEIEEKLAAFATLGQYDPEKYFFWRAAARSCRAVIAFAGRYAQRAEQMAAETSDPERRAQLERIAAACRHVPANAPRTFFEAIQSLRLVHLGSKLEGIFAASIGRIDQYLYPLFMADLNAGQLTAAQAMDLLADLFSFLARQDHIFDIKSAEHSQSSSAIINITVGGVDTQGKDASNELTYLVLHVAGLLRYAQPQVTYRLSPATDRAMLNKALQTNYEVGGGIPQFHNDTHVIRFLEERGATPEEARDWCAHGCSQPVSPRHRTYIRPAGWCNMPLALDVALHDGIASKSGKRIGLQTGDPRTFKTYEELESAVKKQMEFFLQRLAWQGKMGISAWAQRCRLTFTSSILPGCVEKGMDVLQGGQADHSLWYMKDRGLVNLADSLTAIRKLVFEDKRLSMQDLLQALEQDFAGERGEEIRRMCLGAPKYGNEDAVADRMLHDIGKFSGSVISSQINMVGQPYAINRNGVSWHYYGGKGVGALPDGRKGGEPLADGSLSPMRGLDRHGPTAVLNSAVAADFSEAAISILNQRFPRALLGTPEAMDKLAALTEGYMREGGSHIQYNLLDHRTLLDAKRHPERYKDLVVRIAGYSAYFIHLTPEVQDDIIRRTEQAL